MTCRQQQQQQQRTAAAAAATAATATIATEKHGSIFDVDGAQVESSLLCLALGRM
jgi:hypothetical protein